MSFRKMVFYLKETHVMIPCDHSPLNDKVNNWSQEIHTITPHIEFKHIKGKNNILADSLSRLNTLGLCERNTPEKEWYQYSKSVFNSEPDTICSVDNNQKVNQEFDIGNIKYHFNPKPENDLSPPDTYSKIINTRSSAMWYRSRWGKAITRAGPKLIKDYC